MLTLPNAHYDEMIKKFNHLKGINMIDKETKEVISIHIILGASEISRIKTSTRLRIGVPGAPVAEYTKFGWTMMSPGKDTDLSNIYLSKTVIDDYDRLSRLDVLKDRASGDQDSVYSDFKEQLKRSNEGWYKTRLLWKVGHPPLPTNKNRSFGRLSNLLKKLNHQPLVFEEYKKIIENHTEQGIVERVDGTSTTNNKEFYLPHKTVIRETAETTKLIVVFDESAKTDNAVPSLNDCLETGPSLQNLLWNILVKHRFQPVAITGDLKQDFLQIRIRKEDRDSLRFYWIKHLYTEQVEVLRFTRAVFGLIQSPFFLGGTVEVHFQTSKEFFPEETVEEIKESLYVDDLISGGYTKEEVLQLKTASINLMKDGGFELHKWHSNIPELESRKLEIDQNQTYAKLQFGVKQNESKILGIPWNKT